MTAGRFIAFEGGEGMGKSTQARLLADFLRGEGRTVELTREPGGTPGAEAIRELLLSPPGEGWTLEAEALLFAAARADHVARKIRPAIEAGDWVICVSSSAAREAAGSKSYPSDLTIVGIIDHWEPDPPKPSSAPPSAPAASKPSPSTKPGEKV